MSNSPRRNWPIIVGVVVGVFIVGIIATVATLFFLSATPSGSNLRSKLGLANLKTFNIQTNTTDKLVLEESSAIIDANKQVNPAVVSITSIVKAQQQDLFGFGTLQQAPQTAGTGIVVTSDGLIATNKHVVGSGDQYNVTTADGQTFTGSVVARDPVTDLALVKVNAHGLKVVNLGDSDQVEVGQWVIAIGNALGEFQNTLTVGVISAKERSATPTDEQGNTENLDGLFQTDAAINPGNSGGPLVNLKGQVIGINTLIAGNAQNIGFAIPVNDLSKALDSYEKNGKILRPYIGVRYQPITKALASTLGLTVEQGALVSGSSNLPAVAANSPAATAGIQANDVITKIDDQQVTEANPLARIIRRYNPGDKITVTVLRNVKEQALSLTLGKLSS